jgi:hypothetical protein
MNAAFIWIKAHNKKINNKVVIYNVIKRKWRLVTAEQNQVLNILNDDLKIKLTIMNVK